MDDVSDENKVLFEKIYVSYVDYSKITYTNKYYGTKS